MKDDNVVQGWIKTSLSSPLFKPSSTICHRSQGSIGMTLREVLDEDVYGVRRMGSGNELLCEPCHDLTIER